MSNKRSVVDSCADWTWILNTVKAAQRVIFPHLMIYCGHLKRSHGYHGYCSVGNVGLTYFPGTATRATLVSALALIQTTVTPTSIISCGRCSQPFSWLPWITGRMSTTRSLSERFFLVSRSINGDCSKSRTLFTCLPISTTIF